MIRIIDHWDLSAEQIKNFVVKTIEGERIKFENALVDPNLSDKKRLKIITTLAPQLDNAYMVLLTELGLEILDENGNNIDPGYFAEKLKKAIKQKAECAK